MLRKEMISNRERADGAKHIYKNMARCISNFIVMRMYDNNRGPQPPNGYQRLNTLNVCILRGEHSGTKFQRLCQGVSRKLMVAW